MKKRVIIVHRWSGSAQSDWYPWLGEELEKAGFEVLIPEIKNSDEPSIEEWQSVLSDLGPIDEKTYFVAHSIGAQAVLRFLSQQKGKAGGVILVAPWLTLNELETEEEKKIAQPWLSEKFDHAKVAENAGKILAIFSDNDPHVPEENQKIFENEFQAEILIEKERGHFSEDEGVVSLPTVREKILEWEEGRTEFINYDDFAKLDIRVGKILKAEGIEGADKLLKLTVSLGESERTICAGIAEYYLPEEVEGRLVPILLNLKARKLKGVMSEGMMLMASGESGRPIFLSPTEDTQPGDKIR